MPLSTKTMKIPQIVGKNKIRDAKICSLYADDNKTTEELGELFKLTARRVRAILYNNRQFLKIDKDWEKTKRVHLINKLIKKAAPSKKDVADLIDQLRIEVEGNKVEHSGDISHTLFFENIVAKTIPNRLESYANTN